MYRLSVLFGFLLACGGALPGPSAPTGPRPNGRALTRMVVDGEKFPEARCNDGTTPVLYLRRADAANADRWLLWFKGGASCADERGCTNRAADLTSARPWMRLSGARNGLTSPVGRTALHRSNNGFRHQRYSTTTHSRSIPAPHCRI